MELSERGPLAESRRVRTGQQPWRLKFRGYQHDDVLTQSVKTDSEGVAQLNFTPEREGYYRVAWQSSQGADAVRDRFLPPVKAETYVFVATNATTDLGYRHSGVEIVVDKDTFRVGQTAPVMIFVPVSDRYVLFSAEGEDLFNYKLVHVTGNAKLIEFPVEEKHVPNVYLDALMISDANAFVDTKQVVVPPVDRFLAVAVKADREQYQPREEGTLSIATKDAAGRPVSAEIALGLVDESVQYIQQDYAGDPRQFYYGRKRAHTVQTQSTFNQKSYTRLVEGEDRQLRDRKDAGVKDEDEAAAPPLTLSIAGGRAKSATKADAMDVISEQQVSELPINGRSFEKLATLASGTAAATAPQQEPAVQVRSDFR